MNIRQCHLIMVSKKVVYKLGSLDSKRVDNRPIDNTGLEN